MKLKVRFLQSLESRPWEMPGNDGTLRKGVTHKISLMLMDSGETVALKIPESFHQAVVDNGLSFGDVLEVVFAPKVVLKVVNDRAVQELQMLPDRFEFILTAAQSLSAPVAAD